MRRERVGAQLISSISINMPAGSCSGFVGAAGEKDLESFLSKHSRLGAGIARWTANSCKTVAVLEKLTVAQPDRGVGIRHDALMSEFIMQSATGRAEIIFMLAAEDAPNSPGLPLSWATDWDFGSVLQTDIAELMVYPSWMASVMSTICSPARRNPPQGLKPRSPDADSQTRQLRKQPHMNGSVQLFVHQLLRRHQQDCSDAERRVRLAKTMRDVKFAAQVTANAMLRSHPEVRQSLQQLHMHASNRMEQLLEEQLARLGDQPHSEAAKAMRGNLLMNDWVFLRGSYAATYVRAERESHRILYQKRTSAQLATDRGGSLAADDLDDQSSESPSGSSGH